MSLTEKRKCHQSPSRYTGKCSRKYSVKYNLNRSLGLRTYCCRRKPSSTSWKRTKSPSLLTIRRDYQKPLPPAQQAQQAAQQIKQRPTQLYSNQFRTPPRARLLLPPPPPPPFPINQDQKHSFATSTLYSNQFSSLSHPAPPLSIDQKELLSHARARTVCQTVQARRPSQPYSNQFRARSAGQANRKKLLPPPVPPLDDQEYSLQIQPPRPLFLANRQPPKRSNLLLSPEEFLLSNEQQAVRPQSFFGQLVPRSRSIALPAPPPQQNFWQLPPAQNVDQEQISLSRQPQRSVVDDNSGKLIDTFVNNITSPSLEFLDKDGNIVQTFWYNRSYFKTADSPNSLFSYDQNTPERPLQPPLPLNVKRVIVNNIVNKSSDLKYYIDYSGQGTEQNFNDIVSWRTNDNETAITQVILTHDPSTNLMCATLVVNFSGRREPKKIYKKQGICIFTLEHAAMWERNQLPDFIGDF